MITEEVVEEISSTLVRDTMRSLTQHCAALKKDMTIVVVWYLLNKGYL